MNRVEKSLNKLSTIKLSLVLGLILVTVFSIASIYAFQNPAHEVEPNHDDIDPAITLDDNSDPRLAALRKAHWHAIRNHEELNEIRLPISWEHRVLTPDGFCGFFETLYTGEGWNVTIGNPVVPEPTYTVEIDCTVGEGFYWKGTVDQDGNVVETEFATAKNTRATDVLDTEATDVPEGPVFGRETALQYILANHTELSGLENPSKIRTPWLEGILTPEGFVGSNTVQYTKGEWTVTVSNAVVRDIVYSVEVEFTGDKAFNWKGTVDQDGNVVETEFATAK